MPVPEHLANRDLDVAAILPASELPSHARVVIVGGGIIGASIAYHLAAAGERDVVLLERGRLTNGTTWHAAGLVSQVRGTQALTALTVGNAAAYERIGGETGIDPGLRRNGSLGIARTQARMDELLAGASIARDHGVDVEIVGPGPAAGAVGRHGGRRPGRRHPLPDGRHGESWPRGARVRQGGARSRRPVRARHGGGRVPARRRRRRDRRGHVTRRDRRGDRGPGGGAVDLGARASRRRQRRAAARRTHVGDDRRDGPGGRDPAVRPRPRRVPVRPPLPRPPRHRRVRARRPAARPRRRHDRRVRGARARLGSHRAGAGPGAAPDPGPREARVRAVPPRSRVVHAGRELPARPDPGGPGPVRRRGPELAGDHLRAGRWTGGRRVDHRGAPDDGPRRGRRVADGIVGLAAAMAPRADGRVARQPVRHALAGQAAQDRARPAPAAAARRPSGVRGSLRAGRRLGAAAVVRARFHRARDPLRLPGSVVVPGGARRGEWRPGTASRCTT